MGAKADGRLQRITNFGGNQSCYTRRYTPVSEADVVDIIRDHLGSTIRALGSGHSWSHVTANADITLDLRRLDAVASISRDGVDLVRVGAGCRLQDLLDRLHAATERTLPTLGAIKKQTIAGAISTATHGSGRQTLSHFVAGIRAVVFDEAKGDPVIREFIEGPELLAARCGLGCVGIILSVDLLTVPKYMVAETVRTSRTVADIMPAFPDHPLTSFTLSPYSWIYVVFERRPVECAAQTRRDRRWALIYRIYSLVVLDVMFHVGVKISRMIGLRAIRTYQRLAPLMLVKGRQRIDDAEHVLTTHHYLFRHEEMEVFVHESDLPRVIRFLQAAIECFAGIGAVFPEEFAGLLRERGLDGTVAAARGTYVHHYPLFFRHVLPDDTLISMTASAKGPMYSISIFTYDPPRRRDAYYAFCAFVARSLLILVEARLHWGKHFPFTYADIAPLYPGLADFRAVCSTHDGNGVLRNGYTARVLDLPAGPARTAASSQPAGTQAVWEASPRPPRPPAL